MVIFREIIDNLSANVNDNNMLALVHHVKQNVVNEADIAYLATVLGNSGEKIRELPPNSLDVASTGGPSSLSTLLVPLYLRYLGYIVPKLAVPGRPAGGIDVLATIPGYQIEMDPKDVLSCLLKCGYVHFIAGERYAPLDAKLFQYRKVVGAESCIPLVVASLIAKKLAVGLAEVGLDIRVGPHGNFGGSYFEAESNAHLFNKVAKLVGIKATCILTDARHPYQPWIGRGESLVALHELFSGKANALLRSHSLQCWRMALFSTNYNKKIPPPNDSNLKNIFKDNLAAQGSSLSAFEGRVEEIYKSLKLEILANMSGRVVIRQDLLRSILVESQKRYPSSTGFSDPSGVQLLVDSGEYVEKDAPLAFVRLPQVLREQLKRFSKAVYVIREPDRSDFPPKLDEEVI